MFLKFVLPRFARPISRTTRLALYAALVLLPATHAQARQDDAPVRSAIENLLRVQTQGLPGEVSYSIGSLDANNQLAPCSALQAFLPSGARAYGRVHVGVRCQDEAKWQVFVPVQIRVLSDYMVTARSLAAGEPINPGDLVTRRGDLGDLPPGVVLREDLALGQSLRMPLTAGQPLRSDMLKREAVVQAGQNVKVVSRGKGFAVATEGQALANAYDGQIARVRTSNGQTVSGVARPGGLIEVIF